MWHKDHTCCVARWYLLGHGQFSDFSGGPLRYDSSCRGAVNSSGEHMLPLHISECLWPPPGSSLTHLPEGARWRPSSQVFTAQCLGTCKHREDSEAGASIYEWPCQDRLSLDEQLPGGGDGAACLQGCPASSGETALTSLLSYFLNRSWDFYN